MSSQRQQLSIEGMSCAGCVGSVESALLETQGVTAASVNLATNQATIDYDSERASLSDLIASVESAGFGIESSDTTLQVDGMSCASCVGRVEEALEEVPGVRSVSVNLATNEVTIRHLGSSASALRSAVDTAGYRVVDLSADEPQPHQPDTVRSRFYGSAILSALIMGVGHLDTLSLDLQLIILAGLTTPVQFWCGWTFISGFLSAARHRSANMNSLIAVGTVSAFTYSLYVTATVLTGQHIAARVYFDTAAMIITFVLLGRLLEKRARNRTSDAIRALIDLQPETARVLRDGQPVEILVDEVIVGDHIQIRPGDRIPVDGRITEGASSVDEALISGESLPVEKGPGDAVTGGSINTSGSFVFEARAVGSDTALAHIIDLVKQAQASRPPIQRLADRIAAVFVPTIFGIATLTCAAWWLSSGTFSDGLVNAVAVLIISCPCALGLATPTAILVGTGRGAELGLLIKSGEVVETAHQIRTVVLDKTGTITLGRPDVTDVVVHSDATEDHVLFLAGSVEQKSEHPIARALVEEAEKRSIALEDAKGFVAHPGSGVEGRVGETQVCLGNERFFKSTDGNLVTDLADAFREDGKTSIFVVADSVHVGTVAIADTVKPESSSAVRQLREAGLEVAMLTGDNQKTAAAVARKLDLDLVVADVLPEDKEKRIRAVQQEKGMVAMVGDGINDAPALARADVGIAIGTGTDVAIESADVALMSGDLRGVHTLFQLSRRTMRIIKQNLFWAFAYNVLLVPVAALGWLNPLGGPMLAAAAMAFSSVTVVTNALRLKRFKPAR